MFKTFEPTEATASNDAIAADAAAEAKDEAGGTLEVEAARERAAPEGRAASTTRGVADGPAELLPEAVAAEIPRVVGVASSSPGSAHESTEMS